MKGKLLREIKQQKGKMFLSSKKFLSSNGGSKVPNITPSYTNKPHKRSNLSVKEEQQVIDLCQNANYDWKLALKKFKLLPLISKINNHNSLKSLFERLYQQQFLKFGNFSKQEDTMLLDLVKKFGKEYALISEVFKNRSPIQIKNRHSQLECRPIGAPLGASVYWVKDEIDRLNEGVGLYKYNWTLVSKHVGTRITVACRNKYVLLQDKLLPLKIFTKEEDERLIKIMKENPKGTLSFHEIAKLLGTGKSALRVYTRWTKTINPNFAKSTKFSQTEMELVIKVLKDPLLQNSPVKFIQQNLDTKRTPCVLAYMVNKVREWIWSNEEDLVLENGVNFHLKKGVNFHLKKKDIYDIDFKEVSSTCFPEKSGHRGENACKRRWFQLNPNSKKVLVEPFDLSEKNALMIFRHFKNVMKGNDNMKTQRVLKQEFRKFSKIYNEKQQKNSVLTPKELESYWDFINPKYYRLGKCDDVEFGIIKEVVKKRKLYHTEGMMFVEINKKLSENRTRFFLKKEISRATELLKKGL